MASISILYLWIFLQLLSFLRAAPVEEICSLERSGNTTCPSESVCGPGKKLMTVVECPSQFAPCELYISEFGGCSPKVKDPLCCNNYCGGCNIIWYCNGRPIDCFDK